MAFIKHFLGLLFKALLALLLLGSALVVAWWFDWPLFTGLMILCALAALVVLWFAVRQARLWYNKRRYVRHVLTSDPAQQSLDQASADTAMDRAWNKGMTVFASWSTRFHDPVYAQPWALLLGQKGSGTYSIARCAVEGTSPETTDARLAPPKSPPLQWHFLPEAVLLQVDGDMLDTRTTPEQHACWEALLAHLLRTRRKEPVNSVIVTIDAPRLLDHGAFDGLRQYGQLVRARVHELCMLFEARIPITILITKIDRLPGMDAFLGQLPVSLRAQSLGLRFPGQTQPAPNATPRPLFSSDPQNVVDETFQEVTRQLRRMLVEQAAHDCPPDGDALLIPTACNALEPGLIAFLEVLLRLAPNGIALSLRNVLFTSACQSDADPLPPAPTSNLAAPAEAFGQAPLTSTSMSSMFAVSPIPSDIETSPPLLEPQTKIKTQKRNPVPCFITSFFTRQLPDDRALYEPLTHSQVREHLTLLGIGVWYLVLLSVCGFTAANAMYAWQVLHQLNSEQTLSQPATAPGSMSEAQETLFRDLQHVNQRVIHLENANAHWWLPGLGLNRLHEALDLEKARFANLMQQRVMPRITPYLQERLIEARAAQNKRRGVSTTSTTPAGAPAMPVLLDVLDRWLWMQDAVALRRQHGTSAALREQPFPVDAEKTKQTSDSPWTLDFGNAFLNYVDRANESTLQGLETSLNTTLREALGNNEALVFEQTVHMANTKLPQATISISRFWPAMPMGSKGFSSVPPAYTAAGYRYVYDHMERLYAKAPNKEAFTKEAYWQAYITRYVNVWSDFVNHADNAWKEVSQTSVLDNMAATLGTGADPYRRLLNVMADEMTPLREADTLPAWVNQVFITRALYSLLDGAGARDPADLLGTLSILQGVLQNASNDVTSLRNHLVKTHDIQGLLRAVRALHVYQTALLEVRQTLFDTEGALTLARLQFGGKAYGEPDKSAYAMADKALFDVASALGSSVAMKPQRQVSPEQTAGMSGLVEKHPLEAASPLFTVIRGPLRFAASAMTATAAMELQRRWQASVVAQAVLLPPNSGAEPLFGPQGLVSLFLTTQAEPFLSRRVGAYAARQWGQTLFPFTNDFLTFLQQGQTAHVNIPKEAYTVTLHSEAAGVNSDAAERLEFFKVEMVCKKQTFSLTNENYPREETFEYRPAECGEVTLTAGFPSLTLLARYPDFPSFVQEFRYGEREFGQADFPDVAQYMETLGLRRITFRVLPDNSQDVLAMQSTFLAPLPERIAQVW